jgi:hypothetical protein
MLDDVRLGWRKLRQEPSFAAIAVGRRADHAISAGVYDAGEETS